MPSSYARVEHDDDNDLEEGLAPSSNDHDHDDYPTSSYGHRRSAPSVSYRTHTRNGSAAPLLAGDAGLGLGPSGHRRGLSTSSMHSEVCVLAFLGCGTVKLNLVYNPIHLASISARIQHRSGRCKRIHWLYSSRRNVHSQFCFSSH